MIYYKVWVQIERVDDRLDDYQDMGLPDPLGTFGTLNAAKEFVRTLPGWKEAAETSDYRENPEGRQLHLVIS